MFDMSNKGAAAAAPTVFVPEKNMFISDLCQELRSSSNSHGWRCPRAAVALQSCRPKASRLAVRQESAHLERQYLIQPTTTLPNLT